MALLSCVNDLAICMEIPSALFKCEEVGCLEEDKGLFKVTWVFEP